MFGGAGVYRDGLMFGLVSGGELFLKTDPTTVQRFREAGSRPFTFQKNGTAVETSYYSLPGEALDDPEVVALWAETACGSAQRAKRPRKRRSTSSTASASRGSRTGLSRKAGTWSAKPTG